MRQFGNIALGFGAATMAVAVGCAPLSHPATERERTAAIGGLAGGAGGAIIGSMAGGAVAGGLFGVPLGAVAGWYVGDQMSREERMREARLSERDREIDRLRRENERFRREEKDRSARSSGAQPSSGSEMTRNSMPERPMAEQDVTSFQPGMVSAEEIRQAQRKLNEMGYDAGHVDGIWGHETRQAISNFQRSRGLPVSGQLDQKTMDALGIESSQKQSSR